MQACPPHRFWNRTACGNPATYHQLPCSGHGPEHTSTPPLYRLKDPWKLKARLHPASLGEDILEPPSLLLSSSLLGPCPNLFQPLRPAVLGFPAHFPLQKGLQAVSSWLLFLILILAITSSDAT